MPSIHVCCEQHQNFTRPAHVPADAFTGMPGLTTLHQRAHWLEHPAAACSKTSSLYVQVLPQLHSVCQASGYQHGPLVLWRITACWGKTSQQIGLGLQDTGWTILHQLRAWLAESQAVAAPLPYIAPELMAPAGQWVA